MTCPRATTWCLPALLLATGAACKHDAVIRGTVAQSGRGVPGAQVDLVCPDGSKRATSTATGGEFRFEDVGAGVDDACTVEVHAPGSWVAPRAIASQCGQHDAAGLCTEALFAFQVP